MPFRQRLPRPLDIIAILAVSSLIIVASVSVYAHGDISRRITITGESGRWIYPGGFSGRVDIPGPLGVTVVEFLHGEVRVASSPCPTESCVRMGGIHEDDEWLACLPNHVFINIEGGSGYAEPDTVVR